MQKIRGDKYMDDETVERILGQMEKKFGEYRMEQGAKYKSFGKILIDRYFYGLNKGSYAKNADNSISFRHKPNREHATTKQQNVMQKGLSKYYGETAGETEQE